MVFEMKQWILTSTISILQGFVLDIIFGDPYWMPHPVRTMGNGIAFLEKRWNRGAHRTAKGAMLVICMLSLTTLISIAVLRIAYHFGMIPGIIVESMMCYQVLAAKCLKKESMKVAAALQKGDVEEARKCVSMIVGRDTNVLNEQGICKAAVETVAENTSDGEIAPLCYLFLFGATGGMVYKCINTCDSMIGYKNDRYLYFGRVAAKLDDVVNYIPSRLSGILMILAAFITGMDGKNAWKIFRRDSRKHASPNSAQTESVCAGALNLQLAGDAVYFGKVVKKPFIGDANREIEVKDVSRANVLLYGAALIMMLLILLMRSLIYMVI